MTAKASGLGLGPDVDFDAILESIRSRVAGEAVGAASPPVPPTLPPLPPKAARLLPEPVVGNGAVTVDALFRAVLEPMLQQWLDANLPEICERVAQSEIRRLTGRD